MKQGVVKAFNEYEEIELYIRVANIDGVPVVFTTYHNEVDTSIPWVNVDIQKHLNDIVGAYIRGDFEVEWLEPLEEMI